MTVGTTQGVIMMLLSNRAPLISVFRIRDSRSESRNCSTTTPSTKLKVWMLAMEKASVFAR